MDTALAPDNSPANLSRLSRGFAVLAALTFCLIVVGALVRANGAGLACPDWPLCFGEVVPEFDLKVAFEWGHRVFASFVSLGLLVLSVMSWHLPPMRGRLGAVWLLLAVQIVFGGLTVLLSLAPWTVTVHLILGNLFCLSLLWISRDLSEDFGARRRALEIPAALGWLVMAVAVTVGLQMVLGGWVSSHYAGLACIDFPTCDGKEIVPTLEGGVGMHVLHRLNAFLLLALYAATAYFARGRRRIGVLAQFGLVLTLAQIGAGVANVLFLLPIPVTALHSALAAAIVLATAMLVREALGARSAPVEVNPEPQMVEVR